ncbi:unnamed protein product [Durusdinium trenchii]
MGCAASVRHEDTVDAALRRVEQRQLDLCRVRAKSPRKHLEGHKLGGQDPPGTSLHVGAAKGPGTQKPEDRRARGANWTSVMPGMVIDGADNVDLHLPLLDLTSSFLTEHWPEPPHGMRAAFPPNCTMHEGHLAKLDRYLEKVENDPGVIGEAAGLKRLELEVCGAA